jgi:outer membrane protein
MKWKPVVVAALVAAGLMGGLGEEARAAGTRIAYVDVQRVIVRSMAGVAAREQLEREKASMQKDVDVRKTEVDKLRDELEKKGLLLAADARREKEETLQRKTRDLRRLAEDLEKELQRKEQAATQKILQDLTGVIEEFGKERGFLLIVEKRSAGVIYGDPEGDITDEVIRVFDQKRGKAAQPAAAPKP